MDGFGGNGVVLGLVGFLGESESGMEFGGSVEGFLWKFGII